jgi:cytochrome c biogenesis protein CcmG/thiol:disulfide interchange protein DsbE
LPSTPSSAPSDLPGTRRPNRAGPRRRVGITTLLLAGVVVLAVVAVVAVLRADDGSGSPSTSVAGVAEKGTPAPAFDLARLRGDGRVRLADLRGHPVIVNFWASWCVPCRKEFPLFHDAQRRYARDGLRIVAVTFRDLPDDARRFAREHGGTWTFARGDDGDAVARRYGVRSPPQTFFIDRKGTIRLRYFGAPAREDFENQVDDLVFGRR